jgi:hypothetical protein
MTQPVAPELPTAGEIMRAIGRLEKTTDDLSGHLGGKIDRLDDKMDGHADRLTRVEGENASMRKDFTDFRNEVRAQATQRGGMRGSLVAALTGGVSGTVLTGLLQLLSHR